MNARGEYGRRRKARPTVEAAYLWWRVPVAFPGEPSRWAWRNCKKSRIAPSGRICRFGKRAVVERGHRSKIRICWLIWRNYWNQ